MNRMLLLFIAFKLILIVVSAFTVIIIAPQYAHHLLLVIALLLFLSGLGELILNQSQRNWLEFPGTVLRIAERTVSVPVAGSLPMTCHYPDVDYEYEVNTRRHRGSRVALDRKDVWLPGLNDSGDRICDRDRWWLHLQPGDTITVYVNPANAADAVLVKAASSRRRSHHASLLAAGVLFAAAWSWLQYRGTSF